MASVSELAFAYGMTKAAAFAFRPVDPQQKQKQHQRYLANRPQHLARAKAYRMANAQQIRRKARRYRRRVKQRIHRPKKRQGTAASGYVFIPK